MSDRQSVVFVLPDKMGGSTNIVANLLQYRRPDAFSYHAVLTHNASRAALSAALAADSQATVMHAADRTCTVMRRVARAVPPGGGVYVAGDLLDLAVASAHDFGRAVVYMLHGDTEYYYDLAVKHDPIVHAFIAYSRRMYEELLARLPHRADAIFYLPYGIPLPAAVRQPAAGPLRVIYGGRFEQEQKGVFDLPEIDRALQAMGVTVAVDCRHGPDELELETAVGLQRTTCAGWARCPMTLIDGSRCRTSSCCRAIRRVQWRSSGRWREGPAGDRQRHSAACPRLSRQRHRSSCRSATRVCGPSAADRDRGRLEDDAVARHGGNPSTFASASPTTSHVAPGDLHAARHASHLQAAGASINLDSERGGAWCDRRSGRHGDEVRG